MTWFRVRPGFLAFLTINHKTYIAPRAAATGWGNRRRKRIFPEEKSCINDALREVGGNRVSPRAARDPVMTMDIVASKPNTTATISARFLITENRRLPLWKQSPV